MLALLLLATLAAASTITTPPTPIPTALSLAAPRDVHHLDRRQSALQCADSCGALLFAEPNECRPAFVFELEDVFKNPQICAELWCPYRDRVNSCLSCATTYGLRAAIRSANKWIADMDRMCASPQYTHVCSTDCAPVETMRVCTGANTYCASSLCASYGYSAASSAFSHCSVCLTAQSYATHMVQAFESLSSDWASVCTAYSARESATMAAMSASSASVASSRSAASASVASAASRSRGSATKTDAPSAMLAAAVVGALVL